LKEKITKRIYYALVNGVILNQFGTIDAPIGRDPRDRKKMGIVPEGRHAVTHFTVEERFLEHSLLECRLETGRTHQIRVHLAYIGHPLAGDPVYGYRKDASSFGQYLHAGVLGFTHPITQKMAGIFPLRYRLSSRATHDIARRNKEKKRLLISTSQRRYSFSIGGELFGVATPTRVPIRFARGFPQ
jgi:RluA family pseudouridine synthase